jgi:hypothetical protein
MVLAVIQQLTSIKHGRVSLREYDTVERADNYFAEYRMLFLRRRGYERLFNYNTRNIQVKYCTILSITAAFLLLLKTALFGLK